MKFFIIFLLQRCPTIVLECFALLIVSSLPILALELRIAFAACVICIETVSELFRVTTQGALEGDQFQMPNEIMKFRRFYQLKHLTYNLGVLVSYFVMPLVIDRFSCFGDQNCYSMGFGLLFIIELLAAVFLLIGRKHFTVAEAQSRVGIDVIKCVKIAIKKHWTERKTNPKSHWLDHAEPEYSNKFVKDMKHVLSMCTIYLTLPIVWVAYNQLDTVWFIQASKTDLKIAGFNILPDHYQLLNPAISIVMMSMIITIDPYLGKKRYLYMNRIFRRFFIGTILFALSYICAGLLERQITESGPKPLKENEAHVRIFNNLNCALTLSAPYISKELINISSRSMYLNRHVHTDWNHIANVNGTTDCIDFDDQQIFIEKNSKNLYVIQNINAKARMQLVTIEVSDSNLPVIIVLGALVSDEINLEDSKGTVFRLRKDYEHIAVPRHERLPIIREVNAEKYKLFVNGKLLHSFEANMGGRYVLVITEDSKVIEHLIHPYNTVSIYCLFPQIIFFTFGEVMLLSIMEFTYAEAPVGFKSIVLSIDYIVDNVGDLIIFISVFHDAGSEFQFYLYASLLIISVVIFAFVARRFESQYEGYKLL